MPATVYVLPLLAEPQVVPGAIRVAEAARRLGVSPRTVRRWVHRGRLSALLTGGGQTLLSREAVDDLQARVTTDPGRLL